MHKTNINWIKFNLLLISDFLEILQLLKFDAKALVIVKWNFVYKMKFKWNFAAALVDNSEKIFENLFGLMLYRTAFIIFFYSAKF